MPKVFLGVVTSYLAYLTDIQLKLKFLIKLLTGQLMEVFLNKSKCVI